jgi:hypothetical protein
MVAVDFQCTSGSVLHCLRRDAHQSPIRIKVLSGALTRKPLDPWLM